MLLKIYYENIVVAFLNCYFLFFILLLYFSIHPYVSFLFFFSCFFSTTHIYPLLSPSSPLFLYFFFFFYLIAKPLSLSFSSSLFFYFFFFFFYLIPEHSLALCVIRNRERGRERKNNREILLAPPLIEGHRPAKNWRSLCQAAPSALSLLVFLPNTAQMG